MSSTANGFRYPEPSDPPQIDQDIKRLAQDVDSKTVLKTGSTMTGQLTLPGTDPTSGNHAARKSYVDTRTQPVEIKTFFPVYRSWSGVYNHTTPNVGSNPCWAYTLGQPFAGGSYLVTANLTAVYSTYEAATWGLRFTNSGAYSTYRSGEAATVWHRQIGINETTKGSLSMTAWVEMPADTGFSIKLETNAAYWGGAGATPPSGTLDYQCLTITAYPLGKAWG